MIVIVGSANAVNLTDGLDGLAIMPVMIAAGALGVIAYAVGRVDFTEYLDVHYVNGTGEILILCSGIFGAGLGFLWYNAPPAAVFMGDTGSLALGGALGAVAVATKHEIVLAIVGGLFVVEALSVIIQVLYFKMTGKRVFLMAPIHHHFEKEVNSMCESYFYTRDLINTPANFLGPREILQSAKKIYLKKFNYVGSVSGQKLRKKILPLDISCWPRCR